MTYEILLDKIQERIIDTEIMVKNPEFFVNNEDLIVKNQLTILEALKILLNKSIKNVLRSKR